MVTTEQLKAFGINQKQVDAIVVTLNKYSINTPLRIQHFLAQLFHESGNLKFVVENLNYSTQGLNKTFKKYFPTVASTTGYARNPAKIAAKVYASRMGNGDEASGDGWKYRGRGYIQLTGKANYQSLTTDLGIDFISKPELLETIEYAALSAGWFWNKNGLNAFADKDDILSITKRINGGTNGLAERKSNLTKLKQTIK